MHLKEYIAPEHILPELSARTKHEVLAELVQVVTAAHPGLSSQEALGVLEERERLGTTAIGDGVAIPHGKIAGLSRIVVVLGRSTQGADFASLDHKPVFIVALVLAPAEGAGMHLKVLAALARLLRDAGFRQAFLHAPAQRLQDVVWSHSLS